MKQTTTASATSQRAVQGMQGMQGIQGILRHSKIETTFDLYTQEDSDETRAAQGKFLNAMGINAVIQ